MNQQLKPSKNIAMIIAGGIGARVGGNVPKQYIKVKGSTVCNNCIFCNKFLKVYVVYCDCSIIQIDGICVLTFC